MKNLNKMEFKLFLKDTVSNLKYVMPYALIGSTIGLMITNPEAAAELFATIATNPTLLPQVANEGTDEIFMNEQER